MTRNPLVAIIQARMTSTRLPGKVLMDIGGRSALELMVSRVKRATLVDGIVVATTTNATDDPVVSLCERLGIATFRGDEHDVLGRFAGAAKAHGAATVVRLTGDCPIADPAVVDDAIRLYASGRWDYVGNANRRTYPDGLDVEVFSRAALERADREAAHPFAREHVTPYIRGTRRDIIPDGGFARGDLIYPADFSHIRWTLDRQDDLERLRRLVSKLPDGFDWLSALSVATREPSLLGLGAG